MRIDRFEKFNENKNNKSSLMRRVEEIVKERYIAILDGSNIEQYESDTLIGHISYHEGKNNPFNGDDSFPENDRVIEVDSAEIINNIMDRDNIRLIQVDRNYDFNEDELRKALDENVRLLTENSEYKVGDRIELIKMDDPHGVEPGTKGTIRLVDGIGQIHVNWDNGRSLAIIPELDKFLIIKK